ncbi:YitT family protein [Streptococcus zalophi]|uniref:YitT family protein n=1 Tax=Streptococcus zalophi TaxID=640031 RepID=A0A934PAH8_9STRE|nr:YitT family protein [Streptococcus zalophi]MBJ8350112.1 YitT family protein [Streptococcus zalophi]MCR8968113.1 YitT family protein [Streptococcus zalophi]
MIKKSPLSKRIRFVINRWAKKVGLLNTLRSISKEKYAEKISAAVLTGLLFSIAVNFFFQPGHVYSSGVTGLSQIISAVIFRTTGLRLSIAFFYYFLNVPLLILAWYRIGRKFTVFTFISVTLSSLFVHFMPQITLTTDPLVNAIFGGLFMGVGIGLGFRANISSGGTDIVSVTIRKRTGREVGNISMIVNGFIMLFAGILFGWQYALYSMVAIFVSSRVTDAVFTKQRKMQAMIITDKPEKVIRMIHKKLHRGVTSINEAEGTYKHEKKSVLITIISRAEYNEFRTIMQKTDPTAFVSVAENVHIIGRFTEDDR